MQLVVAASFYYAARTVHREMRGASEPSAAWAFVAWWAGIGTYLLIEGFLTLATAVLAPPSLPVLVALRYLGHLLIAIGICGLTYYVVYLWSGKTWPRIPLVLLFAFLAASLIGIQIVSQPATIRIDDWLVGWDPVTPVADTPLYAAILAGFALPPIAACLAYLSLWRRAKRRDQRWRIALVSLSIILYLGSGLVVRLGTNDFLMFVNLTVVGLGCALAVVFAYHAPRSLRPWLGLDDHGGFRDTREPDGRLRSSAE